MKISKVNEEAIDDCIELCCACGIQINADWVDGEVDDPCELAYKVVFEGAAESESKSYICDECFCDYSVYT